MAKEYIHVNSEYPKVVYLNEEKTIWKRAKNKEEEIDILAGKLSILSIDSESVSPAENVAPVEEKKEVSKKGKTKLQFTDLANTSDERPQS